MMNWTSALVIMESSIATDLLGQNLLKSYLPMLFHTTHNGHSMVWKWHNWLFYTVAKSLSARHHNLPGNLVADIFDDCTKAMTLPTTQRMILPSVLPMIIQVSLTTILQSILQMTLPTTQCMILPSVLPMMIQVSLTTILQSILQMILPIILPTIQTMILTMILPIILNKHWSHVETLLLE